MEVPKKRPRMEQLDDAELGQANVESVDANLREHIEAQLLSAKPIFESTGSTALHRAAEQGLAGVVARLLAACPFLISVPEHERGWTALHYAAARGHPAIVAQLLAADPALLDARTGTSAFHLAALYGRAAIVTQLLALKPALIDERTFDGWTALHLAASTGEAVVVAHLLAANPALIDVRDEDGWTALHLAVRGGRQDVVTQLLAASPASIEAKTNDGRTALHIAFGNDKITVAAQLLAAKPSLIEEIINDNDSWAALLNVMQVDHEEAVTRLLAMHPELIQKNTSRDCGWTMFHEAACAGCSKVMSRLLAIVTQPDLEQLLLRRSTDWCCITNEGSTVLHVAARKGDSDMVAQLLAACPALVDVLDGQGRTCLHSAFVKLYESPESSTMCVEVLLAFKPDLVHAVDAQGNTTLHSICQTSRKELIEKVWKMNPGALHALNCHGRTPFHLAVETRNNDNAIDLLQWSMTIDEIVSAYIMCGRSCRERLKPLLVLQREELAVHLLSDVVAIVFEYIGFCTRLGAAEEEMN